MAFPSIAAPCIIGSPPLYPPDEPPDPGASHEQPCGTPPCCLHERSKTSCGVEVPPPQLQALADRGAINAARKNGQQISTGQLEIFLNIIWHHLTCSVSSKCQPCLPTHKFCPARRAHRAHWGQG